MTVTNVAPTIEVPNPAGISEHTSVTIAGTFRDPGWLDAIGATVDWGDGSAVQTLTGIGENNRPDATLAFSTSHTYGDNGTYGVLLCATDDDAQTCTPLTITVSNTNPTATIDLSGTVSVNGTPTVHRPRRRQGRLRPQGDRPGQRRPDPDMELG